MTGEGPGTLVAAFEAAVARGPEREMVRFEGEGVAWGAMREAVRAVAGGLRAWGLEPGDRVALYLENSPSFVASYLGALWAGAVVVPVNTRYRAAELEHMLTDAGARLVVTDAAGAGHLAGLRDRAPSLAGEVVLAHDLAADLAAYRALADAAPMARPAPRTAADLAVIGYTSGTTGRAKGAMLTHGNFVANSRSVTRAWRWTAEDRLLLTLPLFHMHGLGVGLHGALVTGSALDLRRRFDAEDVVAALAGGGVTMFFGVPTMYGRLLEVARERAARPRGLRLLVSGSAPMSPAMHAEVEARLGQAVLERYGMTETVMIAGNPYEGPRRPGSVGRPFAGVELRVADEAGRPLPEGETGEVQLRGPNVCRGYWGRPDADREAFLPGGWFRTGDLGRLDPDGFLSLVGRAKELIISGGFNVYPREVEEAIAEVPGVREVAVLGLPDADLGERVVAVVVGEASDEAILARCRERIAGFKKPREIHRAAALPRNALGKVQKHLLRAGLEPAGERGPG